MLANVPVVNCDCPVFNSYFPLLSVALTSWKSTYKLFTQKINFEGNYMDSGPLSDTESTEEVPWMVMRGSDLISGPSPPLVWRLLMTKNGSLCEFESFYEWSPGFPLLVFCNSLFWMSIVIFHFCKRQAAKHSFITGTSSLPLAVLKEEKITE